MNLKNKKLIMLDFDGTIARLLDLYDLDKVKEELILELNKIGVAFNNSYACFDVFGFCDEIRDEKLRLKALEISHNIVSKAEMDALKTSIEVTGFREFLDYVKENNINIAISTSNCKECIYKYLKDNNLDTNIKVIGREMYHVNRLKPSPWSINYLMNEFNVSKEESIYFGDNPNDYLCAINANIDFFGIAPTEKKRNRFVNFNKDIVFVSDYLELLEYLMV